MEMPPGEMDFEEESDPEAEALLVSLEKLAASDSAQALARLKTIEDPTLLALAISSVAGGWAQADAAAAAKWVESLPADQATDAALGLVPAWAESAPAACLEWATRRPPGELREISLVELADVWSSADPREAFSRFLELENDEGRESGLLTIVSQWALDEPQAAVDHLAKIEDPIRRDEFLQAALVSLSDANPDLTWKFSDRFSDPETIAYVRGMTLEIIAATRPQEAIQLAESAGGGEELLAGIARGWAVEDAAAAKAWLATLADKELAARLMETIAEDP